MPRDKIATSLREARAALSKAERDFPSPKAPAITPAAPPAEKATVPTTGRDTTRQQNIEAVAPILRGAGMTGAGTIGVLHDGGKVPKTGNYLLEKGETVIPADKATTGRISEYRKVYVARRQKKGEGGNSPAPASEKHDQKKA